MENETTTTSAEDTTEAFDAGWDDSETFVGSEATEPEDAETDPEKLEPETKPESSDDAAATADAEPKGSQSEDSKPEDNGGGSAAADTKSETEQKPTDTAEQPKTWTLHHLDETKAVNEQEITALAQKGLDYDRIREKYDASKPVMELFTQSAKQAHMNLDEYVSYIRTEAKKASGMDDTEAKRAVEFEDREAALSAREAAEQEKKSAEAKAKQAEETAEERRKADIAEFQKTFPDAAKDPKAIPQSVWDSVKSGTRLTVAFALYQAEQARQEANSVKQTASAKVQNAKNEARSAGSMRSAGEDSRSKDPFLMGWD